MGGVTEISALFYKKSAQELVLNTDLLNTKGYQVVTGYGVDVERFELDFNRISNKQLYYSERMKLITHQYKAELASTELSKDPATGGFHTDFWGQPTPPPYVAALCVQADPRYPFFGRTQIAHIDAFLKRMEQAFSITEQDLLTHKVNYILNGKTFAYPMIEKRNEKLVFRFHESLFDQQQKTPFDRDGLNFHAIIRNVLLDVSDDLCLNTGDLMIMSNEIVLHRRNECSNSFDNATNFWQSRKMATLRFFL